MRKGKKMKLKLYPLLAAIFLSLLVTGPVGATLISYTDFEDLQATFENDSDYILDDFNLKQGDSEWFDLGYGSGITLDDKALTGSGEEGSDVTIAFTHENTTFGSKFYIPEDKEVTITLLDADGNEIYTETLLGKVNKGGKIVPQFFAIRGDAGELISEAVVTLGEGASMEQVVHNQPAPTPEPATMFLLGSGLIGIAFIGRKKLFRK